ncbi:MAG TPA: hypothetical protein VH186_31530 [Chloroflexia bacterium]|nr:hypothetical protein [Chloroflexia bacterium]
MVDVEVKKTTTSTPEEDVTIQDYDLSAVSGPLSNLTEGVTGLVGQVAGIGYNVATLPLNVLPRRARYHARKAIREGFLTFKVLIDDVTNGVDKTLKRSMERDARDEI